MAGKWRRWSIQVAAWLVGPTLVWGAVTGAIAFVWALLAGLPAVVIALIALAALTLGVALAHVVLTFRERLNAQRENRRNHSPADYRNRLNDSLYPRRNDRVELGERCSTFAMKVQVFAEEQEWRRERAIDGIAEELRQSQPDLDPGQARKDAETRFGRGVQMSYRTALRDEGVRIFEEAHDQGEIAQKARRYVEAPMATELNELSRMFEAIAGRLGYEVGAAANGSAPQGLAAQLDSFIREGVALVETLNVPVSPQQTNRFWRIDGGGAPEEWWEKSDDFTERVRTLLLERHPALLTDYRDGYNAHVREERKKRKDRISGEDARTNGEKMLGLANYERSGPRRVVEASLEGLAAARHRLGNSPPAAS